MKLEFTENELAYLEANLKLLNLYRKTTDIEMARVISKMRYKFSPNSKTVFLTRKERSFLETLFNYRVSDLKSKDAIGEELDLATSISKKVAL